MKAVRNPKMSPHEETLDIAIVGAGIAGLYCAWRLLKAGVPPQRLCVYEASGRTGGRILTAAHPVYPDITFDLGAHGVRDDHELTRGLLGELAIDCIQTSQSEPGALVHIAGRTRSNREIRKRAY